MKNLFSYFIYHKKQFLLLKLLILVLLIVFGVYGGYTYCKNTKCTNTVSIPKKDPYEAFLSESYDKIKENYWDNITDAQLSNIYKLAIEKLSGFPEESTLQNKNDVIKLFKKDTKLLKEEQKKEFAVNLLNMVLVNLQPFGRSALYTTKLEQNLKNVVNNINPQKDLYNDLGVNKDAPKEEINKVFAQKSEELKKEASPEAQKKLENLQYVYNILSNPEKKQNYDQYKVEPTVFSKRIGQDIFYIRIKQLSPATFDEFQKEANSTQNDTSLNTIIIDLRGNIGGAIDLLPYFLGPFIGQNQYAYEFFHKGNYTPFKTKVGWLASLVKFKKVITLIDGETQSSAEVMAATFKKYNVGVVIGTKSKGWGTVEKVFDLENQIDQKEKYSLFLVHNLTLREDNQPIQGNGVEPTININTPDWDRQLYAYYNYNELSKVVKDAWENKIKY